MFNNETDKLKGVADTVLEVIKKSQDKTVDEAITRSVKDGVTTVSYTGADSKNHPGPSGGMARAKKLSAMGMKSAQDKNKPANKKKETLGQYADKKLNEYTPGSGGVTRVKGKSYGASTKEKDSLDIPEIYYAVYQNNRQKQKIKYKAKIKCCKNKQNERHNG